jgi:hypothetical protein
VLVKVLMWRVLELRKVEDGKEDLNAVEEEKQPKEAVVLQ